MSKGEVLKGDQGKVQTKLRERMVATGNFLTLDEIKEQFPPQREEYQAGGKTITSEISRTPEGKIIYVVPGSTKWLQEPPRQKKGKNE